MGLDTTHNAWHGAYSSFGDFRRRLSKIEGFDLDKMVGFGGRKSFDKINTPLKPLIDHSDCDGEISPEHCKVIADRLMEIHPTIKTDDPDSTWFANKVLQFANGCLEAYTKNENLEFH